MKPERKRPRPAVAGLKLAMGIGLLAGSVTGCERDPAPDHSLLPAPGSAAAQSAVPAASSAPAPEAAPAPVEEAFRLEKRPPLSNPTNMNSCAVDLVGDAQPADGMASASREAFVLINGWAADGAALTVPPVVVVQLAGAKRYYIPATRYPRPDVAATSKVATFANSGYQVMASFKDVAPGDYQLRILQVTAAGEAIACDPKTKIKVE